MPDNATGAIPSESGIGSLRWLVTLYRRDHSPSQGADLGVSETLVPIATVRADIQPTYASTFYGSVQVDTPITHMVNIRWADYPQNIEVVIRTTTWPTPRTELFRVRRTKEISGRKRFIQMECELEYSRPEQLEADADRQYKLTEPYDDDWKPQDENIVITSGTTSVVTTGGQAVVAITGPVKGGYITNPETIADQGIAALEKLYVDPVAVPGLGGSGTTSALDPGQSWSLPAPILSGASVWVNAPTSGHKFTVVTWT